MNQKELNNGNGNRARWLVEMGFAWQVEGGIESSGDCWKERERES